MLDFNDIHKYRENNRIEAKKAQGGLPQSLWETYSAFANSFGGVILLGVIENPDKSLSTVPLRDPEGLVEDFWYKLRDGRSVSADILTAGDVSIVESGGNRIVVIEIPRADRKARPVYLGDDPYSGSYRRNGEGDYRCTREEVDTMLNDRSDNSWDRSPILSATLDALDLSSVERYRPFLEMAGEFKLFQLSDKTLLQKIGAAEDGHPTAAGLLMFGKYDGIICEFPKYSLQYSEPGFVLRSGVGAWSGNLFDFFIRVLDRLQARASGKSLVSQALREALANAVVHASYYRGGGLVIENRNDRIVILNSGSLRVNLNRALRNGIADPRNLTLVYMFTLAGIGKHSGSGLSRIQSIWRGQGLGSPEITELLSPDRTSVTLPLPRISSHEQYILEYLTEHPDASSAEIAETLCRSLSRTREILKGLVQRELISTIGKGKNRRYRLKA
ncbi:MAG: RNA-binding domain-containing protein [Oscillospiraceae bacterium]